MLYENFRQVNDRRTDQDRQDRPKLSGHQLTVVSGVAIPEKSILEFKAIFREEWHRAHDTRQRKSNVLLTLL
jgi:hypothetical protein